ncbi:cell division protein FtsI (penicillin-binding protein 3) [Pedobacter psychrotolerans]|uniref:Penicillin-binding protein n=1 Tax=Pedobacter psychrotolerans TaxID=1843235 RepID=A0A4R2HL50_9SPHI|nr:penicillin-binding transpeptidase domain-containing protein [Pedobacter psychrotolerans]TCO30837.1 cell division protein FtsI (penicillin-binding protein 3) [Pedobacter psychrotolerans]GGE44097.1 penicillin-binding protein [Pedobacter psychrotolerans]
MNIRANILLRVYLAFGLIVLFAFAVFLRLGQVQFVQGKKWKAMADSLSTRYVNVEATRGNIYSNDGSLLATSVPEYELRMDMFAGGIADDKIFNEKVDSLGFKLSQIFNDKTPKDYARMLRKGRQDSARYLLIHRKVGYADLKTIRTFPLYNIGKFSGGLIAVQQNKRILPFQALAARTIGYKNENVKNGVGLEGAYNEYINGETGKRLMQRIAGGVYIPVNEEAEVAPKDGADIISTIDINMQDLAQSALEKQLIKYEADHGAVIVMEVATGEIRAVANFSKVEEGVYKEKFNYAIAGNQDPGSTFKLASYMALLEDKLVDTNMLVGTGNYKIPGHMIKDSHGSIGVVTVKKAFEQSSNAAIAYLINSRYGDNPKRFTDHLYDWHLNEKLGLQIPGEAKPVIKNPSNKSWGKMTLPQMAYGYEMQLTPLKMLSFYNAVANNGRYVAPIFVKEIRRLGNPVEQFKARVINEQICSDVTLSKIKKMLEGVVTEGSGKQYVRNPLYRIAGKTGTAQVADANKGYKAKKQYQASFVGYFPADKPKYSMIVVINDPKGGYYGALVSGPVFREVADRIYASDMQMYNDMPTRLVGNTGNPPTKAGQSKATQKVYKAFGFKPLFASKSEYYNIIDTSAGAVFQENTEKRGVMPNVAGMGLKDALYLLGNAGLKTKVAGSGRVISQSIAAGTRVGKGLGVQIELN